MFGQLFAIARNTFSESLRQPIVFVIILASAVAQVFNVLLSAYSMGFSEEKEVDGDDKLLLDMGLATVLVAATLLAAFIATNVLSREIENKTVLTVISKPVGRPLFVIGKYLGVAASITIATTIMLVFFLYGIRHEVMSTARDDPSGPVILFGLASVLIPVFVATWGNYFYNWVFSSTAVILMLPMSVLGYVTTLMLDKEWAWQAIGTDFKPQITLACGCVLLAMLVLTSVALAASTRLGQVMTLVVATGVFVLGLLSNHLLGNYAFTNTPVGEIRRVATLDDGPIEELREPFDLTRPLAQLRIELAVPPTELLRPGMSIYYGADPSGVSMPVPAHTPFAGDVNDGRAIDESPDPAIFVRTIDAESDTIFTIVNAGGLDVARNPRAGDYIFLQPTVINWPARVGWSFIPNVQSFWLVDAITQGNDVPPGYVGLLTLYTGTHVVVFLSVAIILFQRRDVG
ncbi:MAG: ABC transporter permease [Planctomycetota bacterium]